MTRRRTLALAVALTLAGVACQPTPPGLNRHPHGHPPGKATTTTMSDCGTTPGPGLTEPDSPNYDPDWETNYPEVWC